MIDNYYTFCCFCVFYRIFIIIVKERMHCFIIGCDQWDILKGKISPVLAEIRTHASTLVGIGFYIPSELLLLVDT